ncbi:MAG: hypothetical protein Fues2KO_26970 [Fuerstiella sp.]
MNKRRRPPEDENLQDVLYSPPPSRHRRRKKADSGRRTGSIGGWTKFHVAFAAHSARVVATLWFCISLGDFFTALPPYLSQKEPEYEQRGDDPFVAEVRDERNAQRRSAFDTRRLLLKQAWLTPLRDTSVSLVLIALSGGVVIYARQT